MDKIFTNSVKIELLIEELKEEFGVKFTKPMEFWLRKKLHAKFD